MLFRFFYFSFLILNFSFAAWAGPVIKPNTVSTPAAITLRGGDRAIVKYTLEEGPAIITLDIQTNTLEGAAGEWVSIGGEHVRNLAGDVNKIIRAVGTERMIEWQTGIDWPEMRVTTGTRAVLTAWATNAPPDWLVIGLENQNDVRFYAETNFIPYGLSSDYYKTNAIVMRKIPAQGVTWWMGSPETEQYRDATTEVRHRVLFTQDYYLGIYELTQGQIGAVVKNSKGEPNYVSTFVGYEDSPMRPADGLTTDGLTGRTHENAISWPQGGYGVVTANSYIGKLIAKCGLLDLDLPTDAQWEYACRAGEEAPFNNGGSTANDLKEIAWFYDNAYVYTNAVGATAAGRNMTHSVGLKKPNAWMLYDMHGNVQEICLDHLTVSADYSATFPMPSSTTEVGYGISIDPVGGNTASGVEHPASHQITYLNIVHRGGYYNHRVEAEPSKLRSAAREAGSYNYAGNYNGARLYHPAIFK